MIKRSTIVAVLLFINIYGGGGGSKLSNDDSMPKWKQDCNAWYKDKKPCSLRPEGDRPELCWREEDAVVAELTRMKLRSFWGKGTSLSKNTIDLCGKTVETFKCSYSLIPAGYYSDDSHKGIEVVLYGADKGNTFNVCAGYVSGEKKDIAPCVKDENKQCICGLLGCLSSTKNILLDEEMKRKVLNTRVLREGFEGKEINLEYEHGKNKYKVFAGDLSELKMAEYVAGIFSIFSNFRPQKKQWNYCGDKVYEIPVSYEEQDPFNSSITKNSKIFSVKVGIEENVLTVEKKENSEEINKHLVDQAFCAIESMFKKGEIDNTHHDQVVELINIS